MTLTTEPKFNCKACDGTGETQHYSTAGWVIDSACSECNGTGEASAKEIEELWEDYANDREGYPRPMFLAEVMAGRDSIEFERAFANCFNSY